MTTQSPPQPVKPAKAEHRRLRFESIDDLRTEIDQLVAAEQRGTLRRTGNWTLGQALGHLATWIDFVWEGYPREVHPPRIVGAIVRLLLKRRFLDKGMPRGIRIRGVAGGTLGTEPLSTEEGERRLKRSLQRLADGEAATHDSPALGPLSHDDLIAMELRHAEVHLGYFHPDDGRP